MIRLLFWLEDNDGEKGQQAGGEQTQLRPE